VWLCSIVACRIRGIYYGCTVADAWQEKMMIPIYASISFVTRERRLFGTEEKITGTAKTFAKLACQREPRCLLMRWARLTRVLNQKLLK
jgi:hypothetical protein